jgi:hypothetical protein
MPVYVDPLFPCPTNANWRWSESCHLWADGEQELHDFAARIGLRRAWYQKDATLPHYDLTSGRRKKAVALGARETSRTEFAALIRQRRGISDKPQTHIHRR